jgi:dTDP-4-dehydrorhamnose reductase
LAERALPLVHLSTDYVFDGSLRRPYREDDPIAPLGVYGRTKAAGEDGVRHALRQHVILRTAWVYSPFAGNFVKSMLRLAGERDEIGVVGDQRGMPTSALELAAAIGQLIARMLAERGEVMWGTYHLAGAGEATWHELAETALTRWQGHGRRGARLRRISTADYPTLARRPAYSVLDCSLADQRLGIRLPPWPESLARCIDELARTPSEEARP